MNIIFVIVSYQPWWENSILFKWKRIKHQFYDRYISNFILEYSCGFYKTDYFKRGERHRTVFLNNMT